MKCHLRIVLNIAVYSLLVAGQIGVAHAATWNPNLIIPDSELEDVSSMTFSDIHQFLLRHGTLANLIHADHRDGLVRTTAEILYRAAREALLSPKFLLVLMQKEQSLVEDPNPSERDIDWATGYGVCDGCRTDDPAIQRFRGFSRQVYGAALQFREGYLADLAARGRTTAGTGVGITTTIDGTRVTPVNKATAAFYAYTPHLEGNKNFSNIWQRWFGRAYPDGIILTADQKTYWLVQNNQKRKFASRSVLLSRARITDVLTTTPTELEKLPEGLAIRFTNFSLVRVPDGGIYLIDGDTRRPIVSMTVFRRLGFNPEEVDDVSLTDLDAYSLGDPVTLETSYPEGALIQDNNTGGVYFVQDGKKRPLLSKELMTSNYPGRPLTKLSPDELDEYPTLDPVKFSDGTLIGIKGVPDVYLVSGGRRRHIPDESVFAAFGWKWHNIVWTSEAAVYIQPLGDPISLPQ